MAPHVDTCPGCVYCEVNYCAVNPYSTKYVYRDTPLETHVLFSKPGAAWSILHYKLGKPVQGSHKHILKPLLYPLRGCSKVLASLLFLLCCFLDRIYKKLHTSFLSWLGDLWSKGLCLVLFAYCLPGPLFFSAGDVHREVTCIHRCKVK